MTREYVRVKPSRERLNPDDIVSHLSSLHKLNFHGDTPTIRDKLNPLSDTDEKIPRFEFLAVSQGKEAPVEFFYGTDENLVETLRKRLVTAYPESFNVEIVEVDVLEKVVPPVEYDPEDFVENLVEGELQYDPDEVPGTVEDLTTRHTEINTEQEIGKGDVPLNPDTNTETADSPSNTGNAESSVDTSEFGDDVDEDVIKDAELLAELGGDVLQDIDVMSNLEGDVPVSTIDGPTKTEDGTILARPSLENGTPVAARWRGEGERKKDWMTTLKMFSNVANPDADDIQSRAPLATLIQHLAESDLPIAFQIVFERMEDWTRLAEKRKDDLHLNRDTLGQKLRYEIGELVHGSSEEARREKRRDFFEEMGESASGDESAVSGDVGERAQLIDNKIPKRTFRANIRAVSIATGKVNVGDVKRTMNNLASVLDHLDGYFYGLNAKIMEDSDGGLLSDDRTATQEFHKLINQELDIGSSGKLRPDVVMNADELSNFVAVPSAENLTVEGVRGTRAEAESRNPLPRPDPDLMEQFHQPGMRIGYALDEENEPEDVPTQLPPSMLTKHFGRFATTGAGKSKALINDMLSLYENTEGPIVFIDPKGDGMTQNYMRAHFDRFGEKDLKENVVHFPVPDILPGFTFFDIRPSLDQGKRRVDAVQNKADHYEELLKLVMGAERYRESKVAPTIIKALIKSLFDENHATDQYDDTDIALERESKNYFSHNDLERAAEEMRKYVSSDDDSGSIPEVSDDRLHRTLTRHTESDPQDFATIMDALFNRLDYIREDFHLRKIFDNTNKRFDFRDHLNDSKVIMFDLGELRDEATVIMTGLVLMNLWDGLKEHSRTKCTVGHDSKDECREHARQQDKDPNHPPCREPWDDDHLVNLIVDEAASVAVSDIMNKMLEQGRSFHLGVGLSMQYPEQMKDAGERTYRNVLNNVASLLIGKITLDEEIAEAMAHEDMTPEQFSNRIKSLPRGEWIAQLPSPTFQETGPEPFSLDPLPIPAGHPESANPLEKQADDHFQFLLDNVIHDRTQTEYGVAEMDDHDEEDDAESETEVKDGDKSGGSDTDFGEHTEGIDPDEVQLGITESQGGTTRNPEAGMPDHITFQANHGYECERCGETYVEGRKGKAASCCLRKDEDIPEAANITRHPKRAPENTDEESVDATGETAGQATDSNGGNATAQTDGGAGGTPGTPNKNPSTEQPAEPGKREKSHAQTPSNDSSNTTSQSPYGKASPTRDGEQNSHGQGGANPTRDSPTLDEGTPDGTPTKPVMESDLNGDPGSYNKNHIDHEEPVTRLKELGLVIEEWNRSAIFAVAAKLSKEIPAQHDDVREEAFNSLVGHAKFESIKYLPEQTLITDHLTEAVEKGFEPADINLDVSALQKNYHSKDNTENDTQTSNSTVDSANPYQALNEETNTTNNGEDESGVVHIEPQAPDMSPNEIEASPLTRDELGFMQTVLAVMNNNLNIDRTQSLAPVRDMYQDRGADIEKLKDEGYVIEHRLVNQTLTYTVTPKGREELNASLETGPGIGDLGDGIPHRYGADLTMEWLSRRPDIKHIKSFQKPANHREDDELLDIIGYDENGDFKVFVEVEGGASKVEKEAQGIHDTRPGTRNYESLRKDHDLMGWSKHMEKVKEGEENEKLVAEDAESVWVVRNKEVGRRIVRALAKEVNGEKRINLPVDDADRRYQNLSPNQFNTLLSEYGEDGIDAIYTFENIQSRIDEQK
ncbi:ATP-binding protein [Salinibaculum rarum]|uniref:ATP-binding protein n=1 Tax=Salinibaculum rarum TaxID=3058903 RepID=UPI00265DCDD8|nr:DUF87 domain-containing protein [Salinibaculum sp. KK48]